MGLLPEDVGGVRRGNELLSARLALVLLVHLAHVFHWNSNLILSKCSANGGRRDEKLAG